jgi:hypothetical protein
LQHGENSPQKQMLGRLTCLPILNIDHFLIINLGVGLGAAIRHVAITFGMCLMYASFFLGFRCVIDIGGHLQLLSRKISIMDSA